MTIRTNTKMTTAVVERDMSIIESIVLLGQGFEGNPASRQARVHLHVSPDLMPNQPQSTARLLDEPACRPDNVPA